MRRRASVVGLAPVLAFLASFAVAGETPARFKVKSFAEVMPPGTLVYVEVPVFARAREAYRRTPRWKLWWEGAGRKLISEWIASEGDEELASFVRALAESPKLIEGKLAFAMELPAGEDADMPGIVFLADAGDRAGELEKLLANMMGDELAQRQERTIEGVRFEETDGFLLGRAEGLVIGGVGRPAVGDLLARFDERPWQNLAASRAFRMARERVGAGAHFFSFANYGDLWKFLRMEMMDEEVAALTRSGLTQLTATGFGGRFTPEGVVDKLTFILSGRARGMWKLLEPKPLSRATWKALPDFTSGFVSINIPLADRAAPFREMLRSMDPELEQDFVEGFAEFREATGVSFDRDLLPLMAGEMTFAFLEEPEGGIEPKRGEDKSLKLMLLAVELGDAAAARAAMDRFTKPFGMNDPLGRKWRFGHLDGWEVELDRQTKLCVAGSKGVAYIALAPEPIERVAGHLAKRGRMLVDTSKFREATAWIPKQTGFVGHSNVSKVLASLHKLVAAQGEMKRSRGGAPPPLAELLENLTPLTAAGSTEKPGFALEVRSPDGFWAFYTQLVAHCLWRFEVEPMQARRAARARKLRADPRYAAGLKIIKDLRGRLAEIKEPLQRIAAMEEALAVAAGTVHPTAVNTIRNMIRTERTRMLSGAFRKALDTYRGLETPELKIAHLEKELPKFRGTTYERTIQAFIRRDRSVIARGRNVAGPGEAELAKDFSRIRARLAKLKASQGKIAMLKAALPKFTGTRYEKIIEAMITRERTMAVRSEFSKVLAVYRKLKTPAEKVAFLEFRSPNFKGTTYERILEQLIEREKAKMKPPPGPEIDETEEVF